LHRFQAAGHASPVNLVAGALLVAGGRSSSMVLAIRQR